MLQRDFRDDAETATDADRERAGEVGVRASHVARRVDFAPSAGGRSGGRAVPVLPLLAAGACIGVVGDTMLRASGAPGLNLFVWIASVALAAFVLQRITGVEVDRARAGWLGVAVVFAALLMWRDSAPLKLLALGCASLALALAAYRQAASWVRSAGVVRYARAWGTGALHAWTASAYTLFEGARSIPRAENGHFSGWRHAGAVARGLLIAAPLLVVFGALFMSADAVFADIVLSFVRFDFELLASHVALFGVTAWLATGYLRGFLTGTELPPVRDLWAGGALQDVVEKRPTLSITEVGTALAALDALFFAFVVVQFQYLFGGDALVQVTPDLTYAEYARRGFFELVFAVFLVVPVLLSADWLLARERLRATYIFRALAGLQIALVLAITASALHRLRLYHASYGLTDSRFYAMILLLWIGAMLVWFAATVLRGRRDSFAFGGLASGLATVTLLFVLNPDAIIARTNVARAQSPDAEIGFDVSYARSLSADAVPVLIDALPALPAETRCPLALHILRRFGADVERPVRSWSWSASRAAEAVRTNEALLQSMVGPGRSCAAPAAPMSGES